MSTGMGLAWRCWFVAMVAAALGALGAFWAQQSLHWATVPSVVAAILVFMVVTLIGLLITVDAEVGL